MNTLHPKKLLKSKWTAVQPVAREKHFLVVRVHEPDAPGAAIEWVELEAVLTHATRRLDWRDLQDGDHWRQGWL